MWVHWCGSLALGQSFGCIWTLTFSGTKAYSWKSSLSSNVGLASFWLYDIKIGKETLMQDSSNIYFREIEIFSKNTWGILKVVRVIILRLQKLVRGCWVVNRWIIHRLPTHDKISLEAFRMGEIRLTFELLCILIVLLSTLNFPVNLLTLHALDHHAIKGLF